jgi:cytochrome c peroxidase
LTDAFFSSPALRNMARGASAPQLPLGNTDSERRGRRFFEDRDPTLDPTFKEGSCAVCHSGPLLNQTNQFLPNTGAFVPPGTRFQNVLVSEFNGLQFGRPPINPVHEFIFNPGPSETRVYSPDPGRALITGSLDGFRTFDQVNAFKISILWGVKNTAPYFHDNSAKTLEDVVRHYTQAFAVATNGLLMLTPQDEADIVAYLKLL